MGYDKTFVTCACYLLVRPVAKAAVSADGVQRIRSNACFINRFQPLAVFDLTAQSKPYSEGQ